MDFNFNDPHTLDAVDALAANAAAAISADAPLGRLVLIDRQLDRWGSSA